MKKLLTTIFLGALLCSGCKKEDNSNYRSPPHLPDRFIVSNSNGTISIITDYSYNANNQVVKILQRDHDGDTVWVTFFEDERMVRKASSQNTTVYSFVHSDNLVKEYYIYKKDTVYTTHYFLDDEYKVFKSVGSQTTDSVNFEWDGGNNIRSIEQGVTYFRNTYYQNIKNPYMNENKYFRYSWNGGLNFKNTLHNVPDSDTLTYEVIEVEDDKPLFVKVYSNNKHVSNLEFQY
jgi:hypothetical protein